MSTSKNRIESLERLVDTSSDLLNLLDSLQIGSPEEEIVEEPTVLSATITIATSDVTSQLVNVGYPLQEAHRINEQFNDTLKPLHENASQGLTERVSSMRHSDRARLLEPMVRASQQIYESHVAEATKKFLLMARSFHMRSLNESSSSYPGSSHDESDMEDPGVDEPDSDSEEALNIERYYPVLEEMFLKGVERPSRDEKLKLSERTGIPYYKLGIWFQNRRDRGPHAGKGEWMRKYTECRSITPASHVSGTEGAETDDSVSDPGMSEFDEDEWETDPEDVPDLNILELGPSAPHLPVFLASSSSMPNISELGPTPSTPFTSSSRSISFESSSDSFSYNDASFVSTGPSVCTGSPSPLLEPGALLPSLISHPRVPSESHIHESSLRFDQLSTPTPSMSFSSSISPSSFSAPLAQFGITRQMRSNTPSTAPSTPDQGPSTPPTSSFGFDFGPAMPFGNSSRPNVPLADLGLSPGIDNASPSQGAPQTPPMTLRFINFEFSLTPSPTQGKFNDVDLSFGSFAIAPCSSAASFFDSFNSPSSSDSPSDCESPYPQQSEALCRTASPPPRSMLLDFAGVNENNWRPGPTPEPSEVSSQEDALGSKLLAAAASVVSRDTSQQPHNPSPFKLALHHPISPRSASPLMEPLFPLSSPLRDPSPTPSPTSPVMGMLPFLNHALRPPSHVDELATYANIRVEKPSFPVSLAAGRVDLDDPSPLALTRHLEFEPGPAPQLSLFDVLKEPSVPVVDKATRERVDDFFKRYCNGSSNETQTKSPCFPLIPHLPTVSTSTAGPQDIEAL